MDINNIDAMHLNV